jgi:hypothetical protein
MQNYQIVKLVFDFNRKIDYKLQIRTVVLYFLIKN